MRLGIAARRRGKAVMEIDADWPYMVFTGAHVAWQAMAMQVAPRQVGS